VASFGSNRIIVGMTTTRSIRWLLLSLLTAFALLWSPAMAIAQDGSPSEPETTQEGSGDDADEGASGSIDLASPRSAISSFMRAMRAHTGLEPEPRALERALGAVEIPSDVLREADDSEVAFRLYEVLGYFESFAPGEDLASIAPSRNNLPSDGVWTSTLTDADGDTTLLLSSRLATATGGSARGRPGSRTRCTTRSNWTWCSRRCAAGGLSGR